MLNPLTEEKLQSSARCLSIGGKFLEIGRNDLSNENPLYLELFKRNCSFHGIQLDQFLNHSASNIRVITDLLRDGIRNGSVKPITRTCFDRNNAESAFRFMAAAKHIGKVLINIKNEATPEDERIEAIPR